MITDVDARSGHTLVESMSNEVVVRDDSIRGFIGFDPMSYDDAVPPPSGDLHDRGSRRCPT